MTAFRPALVMKNGALVTDVARDRSAAGNTVIELLKRMPDLIIVCLIKRVSLVCNTRFM